MRLDHCYQRSHAGGLCDATGETSRIWGRIKLLQRADLTLASFPGSSGGASFPGSLGGGERPSIHCVHMHLIKVSNHVEFCGCVPLLTFKNLVAACNDAHSLLHRDCISLLPPDKPGNKANHFPASLHLSATCAAHSTRLIFSTQAFDHLQYARLETFWSFHKSGTNTLSCLRRRVWVKCILVVEPLPPPLST